MIIVKITKYSHKELEYLIFSLDDVILKDQEVVTGILKLLDLTYKQAFEKLKLTKELVFETYYSQIY